MLGADIDATDTQNWGMEGDAGFNPIGNEFDGAFTGKFDGLGHQVSNLSIDRPYSYQVGLFGAIEDASVRHIGVNGGLIRGDSFVGGLVGQSTNSLIQNSFSQADVEGYATIGGLVGGNFDGKIQDSFATGNVTGENVVAGLVGENLDSNIETSYATGLVTATQTDALVGGLLAKNTKGSVNNSIWDKEKTGQTTSAGSDSSFGRTQADMFDSTNYTGFDFDGIWDNAKDQTTAYLKQHKGQNHVALKDDTSGKSYSIIQSIEQLQQVDFNLDGNYLLGNDIDANITQTWADSTGQGFNPLGNENQAFTGSLNGLGHEIKNLYIERLDQDKIGLISHNQGTVNDLGVVDAQISGKNQVGGVIGHNQGQANAIYSSGQVTGQNNVGGLIGHNQTKLEKVYSQADVDGKNNVGGLVGLNEADIQDVYSSGDVTGEQNVGGLVGQNLANIQVDRVFSLGKISGTTSTGALIGDNAAAINDAYWHQEINPNLNAIGTGQGNAQGLSTEQLTQADSYAFLDSDSTLGGKDTTWRIYEGHTSPLLRHFLTTQDLSLRDKTTSYTGLEQFFADVLELDETKYVAEGQVSGTDAGEYKATYYTTDQQGYDFIGNKGTLIIDKAAVTVQGSSETDKIYNGQQQVMQNPQYTVEGLVNGESEALLGTITVSGASGTDAGSYVNKIEGENSETKNYSISYKDGEFNINKKKITITATDEVRKYNGAFQAVTGFIADGLVEGEDESVLTNINSLATRKDAGNHVHAVAYKNSQLGEKNYEVVKFQNATYVITKADVTITSNNLTTVYNGEDQTVSGFEISGLKGNDQASVLGELINLAATGRDVGEYENQTIGTDSVQNYNIHYKNGILQITPKTISGTITAQDRVYDGSTNAILDTKLDGVIAGDQVNLDANGQFVDKNAGVAKRVNVTGTLSGTDSKNYKLDVNQHTQADIAKAKLNIIGNSNTVQKDGQSHSITGFTAEGLVGTDTLDDLTEIVASGAQGTEVGTYINELSGKDNNYEINFINGQLIIDPAVDPVDPIKPVDPINPEEPNPFTVMTSFAYQRAIQYAQTAQPNEAKKPYKSADSVEIEIIGEGINMNGIQTLNGDFN